MHENPSFNYKQFAEHVMHRSRYVLDDDSRAFVDNVLRLANNKRKAYRAGKVFHRAQIAHTVTAKGASDRALRPADKKRMTPLPDRAKEGRVNPKGIPCLYVASDAETAISEVRPWVGAYVSIAMFTLRRDVTLVDCTISTLSTLELMDRLRRSLERTREHTEEDAASKQESLWFEINHAFSEPVSASDDVAEYAPTQVLAENFREHGYDGILYRSALAKGGLNLALFDRSAAKCGMCSLCVVTNLTHEVDFDV